MEDQQNGGMPLLLGALVLFLIAGGVALFFFFNAESESETSTNTDSASETSELSEDDSSSDTYSVDLSSANVSFFVPNSIEQVENVTVYKRYQSVEDCEFVGQDEDRELLVVAFSDEDCIVDDAFESTGSRTVTTDDGTEFSLNTSATSGSKAVLLLETVEAGNGVSLGFFYKEEFSDSVSETIVEILSGFEVEVAE